MISTKPLEASVPAGLDYLTEGSEYTLQSNSFEKYQYEQRNIHSKYIIKHLDGNIQSYIS